MLLPAGPGADGFLVHAVQKFPFLPADIRICFSPLLLAVGDSVSSGSREWNDRLSFQVMLLDERVYPRRSNVPPDREPKAESTIMTIFEDFRARRNSDEKKLTLFTSPRTDIIGTRGDNVLRTWIYRH